MNTLRTSPSSALDLKHVDAASIVRVRVYVCVCVCVCVKIVSVLLQ